MIRKVFKNCMEDENLYDTTRYSVDTHKVSAEGDLDPELNPPLKLRKTLVKVTIFSIQKDAPKTYKNNTYWFHYIHYILFDTIMTYVYFC